MKNSTKAGDTFLDRHAFRILLLALLLSASHGAWAISCTVPSGDSAITFPAAITIPSSTPAFTKVATATSATIKGSCYTSLSTESSGMAGKPQLLTALGKTFTDGGYTYPLYDSGVPGLGIAILQTNVTCGTYNDPLSLTGKVSYQDVEGYTGIQCGGSANATISSTMTYKVMLVTTVTPFTGSGTAKSGIIIQSLMVTGNNGKYQVYGVNRSTFSINPVNIIPGSCTTPDVVVSLGSHSPKELPSLGASTNAVDFSIALNACPMGINSIKFRLDPVTAVVDSAQSVVALDASSTAAGLGVQILDGAGAPLPLSENRTFSTSVNLGGSYQIPLKARYYRTGTVSTGKANSSVQFTIQYE